MVALITPDPPALAVGVVDRDLAGGARATRPDRSTAPPRGVLDISLGVELPAERSDRFEVEAAPLAAVDSMMDDGVEPRQWRRPTGYRLGISRKFVCSLFETF